jgi:hypothetical protein
MRLVLREVITTNGSVATDRRPMNANVSDRGLVEGLHLPIPLRHEVTELRLSVPEAGKCLLPLPVTASHATVGARTLQGIAKRRRVGADLA